jgi:hypothetical protein
VTADYNYLFSAGKDGVLYIYKLELERVPAPEEVQLMAMGGKVDTSVKFLTKVADDKD